MAPNEEYSRADVRRQFGLSERLLRSWERLELISHAESYTFSDLIAIQTLIKLRESHIQPRQIGLALQSLRQKLDGVKQPLSELRIVSDGRKIAVHVAGQKMEAISGQILLDFEAGELGGLRSFPDRKHSANRVRESEAWFQKGLELEETGAPVEEAIQAYEKVLTLNPAAAGALVNLGTIYYRQRKFVEAEKYYQRAIAADRSYPLAQFNIGNLYDEQNRVNEALDHYRQALALNPKYADAHFNLALLSERTGDNLKAVHHWKAYLKLDSSGQWAEIARRQLERLRQATLIHSR
ncbi:Tetratricopeptide TPR_2 repeat protein [Candidatus Sulfopaludibacter sp. SbA6]|nr:Tetratricopeptide TPR_2 repeat protein [Candidatus Sulfopaludibacter sp. SbA6]